MKTTQKTIKLLDLAALFEKHRDEFMTAIEEPLKKTAYIGGADVAAFEAEFAAAHGSDYAASGCGNGTDAIYIAARALQLPSGSEAIVPAMTYFATVEALHAAGFQIRLVDVDRLTGLIDLTQVEAAITANTKLIVPVHLYGQMVAMEDLSVIAQRHSCKILEDASQAHGALYKKKPVGYFSDIATYSFYPGKNLGAWGDAGAIVSRHPDLIQFCRAFGNHGGIQKYDHQMIGTNSRLDTIQASVLRIKLKYLPEWNNRRREIAAVYYRELKDTSGLDLLACHADATHVHHLFPIKVHERDEFMAHLKNYGIESGIHYPRAIHQLPALTHLFSGEKHPQAQDLAQRVVSLPMCPTLTNEEVSYVCTTVREFFASSISRAA